MNFFIYGKKKTKKKQQFFWNKLYEKTCTAKKRENFVCKGEKRNVLFVKVKIDTFHL